jgi:type I restriction enzyme S subunit
VSAPTVALGDVADFIRGVTYKPADLMENFSEGSIVCMRTANIQKTLDESSLLSIPRSLVKNDDKMLREGDLLVSTANSWNLVGKCCWVPPLKYAAAPGGFIAALRGDQSKVDPRYLYHWFNSPDTQSDARNCGRQTTNISNMDIGRCLALKIPVPPLPDQRRIAAILDKADALRAKRRDAVAKLDQLLQSVFLNVFGDVSSNDQGWPEVALGDVVESTKLGLVRGASEFGYGPEFNVPYIRMDAIGRGGEFLSSKVRMTKAAVQEIKESSVRYGDLLFNTRNSKDLVGKSTVFEGDSSSWTFNNNLMRIRFTDRANSFYILRYLMSRVGQAELEKRKSGTTSVFAIYYKDLKTLPVVLPPKSLQDKFQRIVEDQRRVRERVVEQEARVQSLVRALQHAAFSGQL